MKCNCKSRILQNCNLKLLWLVGITKCTKFGQLILRKIIIKIVATRCHIIRRKCTKSFVGWGSAPDPARGAYNAPRPYPQLDFSGLLLTLGKKGKKDEKRENNTRRRRKKRGGKSVPLAMMSQFDHWLVERHTVSADEAGLLQLSQFSTSQIVRRRTASEESESGVNSQPLGQPRQSTVTDQRIVRYTPIDTQRERHGPLYVYKQKQAQHDVTEITSRDSGKSPPSLELTRTDDTSDTDGASNLKLSFTVTSPIIARMRPRASDGIPAVTSRCDVIGGNTVRRCYVHYSESLHAGENVVRQRCQVVLVQSST